MDGAPPPTRGRGASFNPESRFARIHVEPEEEGLEPGQPPPRTQFFRDASRSVLVRNDSPDVPFAVGLNPYRGCEHGCIYCYARPTHEYLGFSAGLDFESRILVKEDAPELLRRELSSPKWKPEPIAMCGVTDPYQPIERKLQITRRCLEVLLEFRNPVGLITKNHLVTRDLDILARMASYHGVSVSLSITTLDFGLSRAMEPRTSIPELRLQAIRELTEAGVPAGVMVAPVIPGLTDREIPKLLEAAAQAGARHAGFTMLRLPQAVGPLFERWLEQHYPLKKQKILSRLREVRGGKVSDSRFGRRMRGEGFYADQVEHLFEVSCRRAGIPGDPSPELSTAAFRRAGQQELLPPEEAG